MPCISVQRGEMAVFVIVSCISVELRSVLCGVAVFVKPCSAVLIQEVPNEVAVFVKHGKAKMLM